MAGFRDEERLPRWAQDRLEMLRRRVVRLEAEVGMYQAEADGSTDTLIRRPGVPDLQLPDGTSIKFTVGERSSEYIEVRAGSRAEDEPKFLDVRSGWGQLWVAPQSGNTARLYLGGF